MAEVTAVAPREPVGRVEQKRGCSAPRTDAVGAGTRQDSSQIVLWPLVVVKTHEGGKECARSVLVSLALAIRVSVPVSFAALIALAVAGCGSSSAHRDVGGGGDGSGTGGANATGGNATGSGGNGNGGANNGGASPGGGSNATGGSAGAPPLGECDPYVWPKYSPDLDWQFAGTNIDPSTLKVYQGCPASDVAGPRAARDGGADARALHGTNPGRRMGRGEGEG